MRQPTRGPQYVANRLRLDTVNVSAGGVRGVWLRHEDPLLDVGSDPIRVRVASDAPSETLPASASPRSLDAIWRPTGLTGTRDVGDQQIFSRH